MRALEEWEQIVEFQWGKVLAFACLEVGSGAFHPQNTHFSSQVITLGSFGRCVATAPDAKLGLTSDESRAVNELIEGVFATNLRIPPQRFH